jgi:hypothetical protein
MTKIILFTTTRDRPRMLGDSCRDMPGSRLSTAHLARVSYNWPYVGDRRVLNSLHSDGHPHALYVLGCRLTIPLVFYGAISASWSRGRRTSCLIGQLALFWDICRAFDSTVYIIYFYIFSSDLYIKITRHKNYVSSVRRCCLKKGIRTKGRG